MNKNMMTPKQLVLDQTHHKGTVPIPYTLTFETSELMEDLDRYYSGCSWRDRSNNHIPDTPMPHQLLGIPGERLGQTAVLKDLFGAH